MSSSAAITGELSVKPYPCNIFIPKLLKPLSASGSKAAPPATNNLAFPPRFSCTSLNIILLISIPNFNKKLLIFIPFFTVSNFPFFSIPFIIFLYIVSYKIGTDIIAVTWNSFTLSAICLIPSQNAIEHPFEIGYKKPTVHSKV